jgi:hypothetical protein
MTYTVVQLITDSYYLSGRLARGLQIITGSQLNTGLRLLNAVITVKSVNERLIPYFTEYQFNAVVGQEEYFISNLIYAETLTFNYQNVRYSMQPMGRKEYQGSPRVNNIQSLMFDYHVERTKGGSNLFMYFLPDMNYPCTLWGKFSLTTVALNQNLEDTLDQFYIEYLRYALAEYICHDNNIAFQPQNKEKLEEYEQAFLDIGPPDLTIEFCSGLRGSPQPDMFCEANIARGWRPY